MNRALSREDVLSETHLDIVARCCQPFQYAMFRDSNSILYRISNRLFRPAKHMNLVKKQNHGNWYSCAIVANPNRFQEFRRTTNSVYLLRLRWVQLIKCEGKTIPGRRVAISALIGNYFPLTKLPTLPLTSSITTCTTFLNPSISSSTVPPNPALEKLIEFPTYTGFPVLRASSFASRVVNSTEDS